VLYSLLFCKRARETRNHEKRNGILTKINNIGRRQSIPITTNQQSAHSHVISEAICISTASLESSKSKTTKREYTMRIIGSMLLLLLGSLLSAEAFVPAARCPASRQHRGLFSVDGSKESEKQLRQEIAERNSKIENEGKYAVPDGENLSAGLELEAETSTPAASKRQSPLEAKLERLTQPRAYPLFLAEKAAELIEGTFKDFAKALTAEVPSGFTNGIGKREKIVILGTGWGR
jgi:hypothetical protein